MIKVEKIERLVQLIMISGYVKDGEAPLSCNLIANPESGKTKIIEKFICPQTFLTSDLSQKVITDILIPKLEKNEIHHIIIPDMIKVLTHKKTTVESTVTFLNALMEEGVKQQIFFGQSFSMKRKVKCGLITSMTPEFFYDMFRFFHKIGYDTRYLPISFYYSSDTISDIHQSICDGKLFNEIIKMKTVRGKEITIPKDIAITIMNCATITIQNQKHDTVRVQVQGGKQKTIDLGIYGFRLQKQYRKLIKSIALMNNRNIVNQEDLAEFMQLTDYIRLPKNPKEI